MFWAILVVGVIILLPCEFFCRVRAANVALKPSKCFVGYTDLVFLGHKIGQEGVSPSEELFQTIQQVSPPNTRNNCVPFWA